jgi:hypothetical protein
MSEKFPQPAAPEQKEEKEQIPAELIKSLKNSFPETGDIDDPEYKEYYEIKDSDLKELAMIAESYISEASDKNSRDARLDLLLDWVYNRAGGYEDGFMVKTEFLKSLYKLKHNM